MLKQEFLNQTTQKYKHELKRNFNKEIVPQLKETLGLDNVMAVPRVTKIVVNMGVGEAAIDKKHLESARMICRQ